MKKRAKFNVVACMMLMILGLTFQPSISTYAACPDQISSYWKLDEPTPTDPNGTYVDFVKDNDGTGNANPTAATGIVNGAQEFNGTDTQINVPADNSFDWQRDKSFSIEFWVKTDGVVAPSTNQVIIGRDDAVTGLHWWVGMRDTDGLPCFSLTDTNGNGSGPYGVGIISLSDGSWHHVVAVRDDSTDDNIIYVDREERGRTKHDYTAGFWSATAALNIGWLNLAPYYYFDGFIDEVALYDRALPLAEIQAHYDAGLLGNGIETLRPAPEAVADGNPTNPKETTVVTLDGTGSSVGYAGTTITSYLWEQTAGTQVTLSDETADTATFTAPDVAAAGETLVFTLTVTADDGQSDSDTINIGVVDRILPVADAGTDQDATEGDTVTLDGSISSDADGTIASYQWAQTGGTAVTLSGASTDTATFTAPDVAAAGETLVFRLTVTDDDGQTSSDTVSVNVSDSTATTSDDTGGGGGGGGGGCFINTMF